jgi:hypothetical protein
LRARRRNRGRGTVALPGLPVRPRDQHEIVGARERQRTQEDGVDDAEDRRVGADADRNRQDREHQETRRPPERARGVPNVLKEVVDH